MTIIEAFTKELEQEAITTRKMLSCVPTDKFDWQPHPKSMTVKALAIHVAELPTWIGMTLHTDGLDFATTPYQPKDLKTTEELLAYFEECLEEGRKNYAGAEGIDLNKTWTLSSGEIIFVTDTKYGFLRNTMSQMIHHRAQLGVYLRLLDIPIPGSYGPSADEK